MSPIPKRRKMEENKDMYLMGYPIVWNQKTELYPGYYEQIDRNAMQGSDISMCALTYNHEGSVMIVAATKNDSLKLTPDSIGLKMVARLSNTTQGRDLYELVRGGYLDKMSFAFVLGEEEYDANTKTRTVKKIKTLYDCAVVQVPAYKQSSVSVMKPEQIVQEQKRRKLSMQLELMDMERERAIGIYNFERERGRR